MALEIRLHPPKGTRWSNQYHSQHKGSFAGPAYWQLPFVQGDAWQMRGWLEGLSGFALDGFLEIAVHEGLVAVTGTLDTYEPRTGPTIEVILDMIHGVASSLAARFPKMDLRLKVSYQTTWEMPAA